MQPFIDLMQESWFSKKTTEGVVRLEHRSVELNLSKKVKLDVFLNDKLMGKVYVKTQERAEGSVVVKCI